MPSRGGAGPSAGWSRLTDRRGAEAFVPSAFTRLARVQALATAADTLVATSLAGSLFFSIPTGEARGRVALYLLLTIAPFAVVGPLMGPALDRMPGGRRLLVIGTGVARVVVCLLMARHVDSLLLFPEAFAVLVLGKSFAIARSALVPTVVEGEEALVEANSRLSLLSGVCGFVAAVPGALLLKLTGAGSVLLLAAVVSVAQAVAATRLPATQVADAPADEAEEAELRSTGVVLASEAMGLLRGVVGFMTFLLAFALRGGADDTPVPVGLALGRAVREAAGFELSGASGPPTSEAWQFGVVLGASLAGVLVGAAVAPRLRQSLTEEQILQGGLALTVGGAVLGALVGGVLGAVAVAAAVAVASSAGKLAFDSIVQRDAPDANIGRSFAQFETRFQLVWVVGGFLPVIVPLPARVGFLLVAGAAALALLNYRNGRRGEPDQLDPLDRRPHEPPEAEQILVGPHPAPTAWQER